MSPTLEVLFGSACIAVIAAVGLLCFDHFRDNSEPEITVPALSNWEAELRWERAKAALEEVIADQSEAAASNSADTSAN